MEAGVAKLLVVLIAAAAPAPTWARAGSAGAAC